jgi:hypothetical protein
MFWLDGFYAAQAGIGADGLIVDEANDDRGTAAPSEDHKTAEHRLSHPITRALHAAYQTGEAPSVDSLAAMLARLDLIR